MADLTTEGRSYLNLKNCDEFTVKRQPRRRTGQVRQTEHIDCGNFPGHRDSHCTFACNVQYKKTLVVRLELPVAILTI